MPEPNTQVSLLTRTLARQSERCPVCRSARRRQGGVSFWIVKTFEDWCPFCRAYERVNGRKSHEAVGGEQSRGKAGEKQQSNQ